MVWLSPEMITVLQWTIILVPLCYILAGPVATLLKKQKNKKKIEKKKKILWGRKHDLIKKLAVDNVLVTPERSLVLNLGILELSEKLKSGHLLPITVLEAYQARALEVSNDVNAVCDFILEAEEWAKELEDVEEEDRGPLYGIPVSVKECFLVKNYDATIGLQSLIGLPAEEDCHLVGALKSAHAVPFCLTNFPQTLISFGCSNPIYGETLNPHDKSRTCGGSSGGEAALIAAGGSILGIGTDLGGSVRIPAHMSGICSLKPTNGRIYESGQRASVGTECESMALGVTSSNGFMSQSVEGITLAMKALLANSEKMAREDWRVAPIPWRENMFNPGRKLKIGWYDNDGYFPTTPGPRRAVHEAKKLLQQEGHEVVEFNPPELAKVVPLCLEFLFSDKGHHALKAFNGEVLDRAIESVEYVFKTPRIVKILLSPVLRWLSPKLEWMMNCGSEYSRDLWVKNAEKDKLTYNIMAAWEKGGFDVLLAPAAAIPAPPSRCCSWLIQAVNYTPVYNIMSCPAGVVPITKETAEDQKNLDNYPVKEDLLYRLAAWATRGAEGLPLGVQVVGRRWQEELVLHVMGLIQTANNKQ